MAAATPAPGDNIILYPDDLERLFGALQAAGYQTIGPTLGDDAIIYAELRTACELPVGWTDTQEAGLYRLRKMDEDHYFHFTPAAASWKEWLRPPVECLWRAVRTDDGFTVKAAESPSPAYAFIGVRACELHAIQRQDAVYLHGPYADASYRRRRARLFIVAVNCTRAGGTCFCVSTDTGPHVGPGYDLAITELTDDGDPFFVVQIGSQAGAILMAGVPHREATDDECEQADCAVAAITAHMGRTLETEALPELLNAHFDDPLWAELGERCLTCGNCTSVCPTCFCSTVEDLTNLSGAVAERRRRADSCFTTDFAYIHGGSVRASARARYRQWLTHKLASWHDQFGSSGCVGCGRCITWCPVGIDLTQVIARLQSDAADTARKAKDLVTR